jgi:hypothetical protein
LVCRTTPRRTAMTITIPIILITILGVINEFLKAE